MLRSPEVALFVLSCLNWRNKLRRVCIGWSNLRPRQGCSVLWLVVHLKGNTYLPRITK